MRVLRPTTWAGRPDKMMATRKRHSPEQIVRKLMTADRLLAEGKDICRVDVAGHTEPVWAKTSKETRIFFARFNNSTRAIPDDEVSNYVATHWGT